MTLISRLESATEGSRELDALIWLEADHDRAQRVYNTAALGMPRAIGKSVPDGLGRLALEKMAPHYTTSIDAALTLVPKGLYGSIAFGKHNGAILHPGDPRKHFGECRAATPALALCIAALKARSAP